MTPTTNRVIFAPNVVPPGFESAARLGHHVIHDRRLPQRPDLISTYGRPVLQ
jgi:hypothetical protein